METPRNLVWDIPVMLSPNAIEHLKMCLVATESFRGLEPWEWSLHESLEKVLQSAHPTQGTHDDK
jgi:hypothetical protein